MRGGITREGDEDDVLTAGRLDVAAADDALAVGEEDDLEQHRRWVGGCAGGVVLVVDIESAEVDLMVEQVVECVLNGAGQ